MSPDRNNPLTGPGHAILADRVFDGHGWHAEAAVLIRDGLVAGVDHWGEVPADWPQTRLAGRRVPRSGLHRSAGQRRRRRSAQRSADGRRHARHRPGAPPLWHDGVPADPDHRYARADADRHCGGALDRGPGRDSRPASGRPVHQSAASGGSPARPDRASLPPAIWRICANSPAPARHWSRWRRNAFRRALSGRLRPPACGFRSGTARRPPPLSCRPSRMARPA